jgi:hypothetical protein
MMRHTLSLAILLLLLFASSTTADNSSQAAGKTQPTATEKIEKAKPMPGVTPEREAAVRTFLRQHHPELADLLLYLQTSQPHEYQRAVRDLFRASERLAQIQERDYDRYELELKLWKTSSRIQLLAARLSMNDSDDLRAQLRAALSEQIDLRAALLRRERDRLAGKVSKIDEQLNKLMDARHQEIERQMKVLTKSADGSKDER